MNPFSKLGIRQDLIDRLTAQKICEPTDIQRQTIPVLMERKDIVAQARTGSGKTLAFLLPMLSKLDADKMNVQALIVTPTRELAIQVTAEYRKLTSESDPHVLAVYGGQDVLQQISRLKENIQIIIGTPGRLLDHIKRGTIDLSRLEMLVLDEADQMLHIGFLTDVEAIINQTPMERQTALFSATMPDDIRQLADRYMQEPDHISVRVDDISVPEIKQYVVETTDRKKQPALRKAIKETEPFMGIIFCRTKRRVSKLNQALQEKGYLTDELHGGLSQAKREEVMQRFRDAQIHLLIATDVAARGLDVEGVTHIYNYDVPLDAESYIHRIGRTGRAGQYGVSVTFIAPKDFATFNMIEKQVKTPIERMIIDEKLE